MELTMLATFEVLYPSMNLDFRGVNKFFSDTVLITFCGASEGKIVCGNVN